MTFTDITEYMKLPKSLRQEHLRLDQDCIEIGGNSHQFRALMAHELKTTIPKGMRVYLCHACHNAKCSNPRHLYWGSASENLQDAYDCGNRERKFYGRLSEQGSALP